MTKTPTRRLASEIASLVSKYPGLGQDVFVHEHDYNQAANSVVALEADLSAANEKLATLRELAKKLIKAADNSTCNIVPINDLRAELESQ